MNDLGTNRTGTPSGLIQYLRTDRSSSSRSGTHRALNWTMGILLLTAGVLAAKILLFGHGPAYELRLKFTAGENYMETSSVRMTMTMSAPAGQAADVFKKQEMGFEARVRMETHVAAVGKDGTASIEGHVRNLTGSLNVMGMKIDIDSAREPWKSAMTEPLRLRVDPHGRILSHEGNKLNISGVDFMQFLPVFFAKEKVGIGDTWTSETSLPMPGAPVAFKVTMTQTLDRIERYQGEPCAVIKTVTMDMALDNRKGIEHANVTMKADGNVQTYLGLESGQIWKTDGTLNVQGTMTPTEAPQQKMVMTGRIEVASKRERSVREGADRRKPQR